MKLKSFRLEEQRYYEYSNALPDQLLITLLNMKPENHNYGEAAVTMSMPMSIGYYFIDRVLGGPGTEYSLTRDYTDIELASCAISWKKPPNDMRTPGAIIWKPMWSSAALKPIPVCCRSLRRKM